LTAIYEKMILEIQEMTPVGMARSVVSLVVNPREATMIELNLRRIRRVGR
jgi:hypothetical protein